MDQSPYWSCESGHLIADENVIWVHTRDDRPDSPVCPECKDTNTPGLKPVGEEVIYERIER